jgi:ribonuclease BN (tRNA processing enzyme)
MMKSHWLTGCALLCALSAATAQETCNQPGLHLQVLGSGGPEVQDRRASSSYLVWLDGKPRVLVDSGGGAALRFGESGAQVADLDVILLTHLHVDHTADLPALIKSSWFEDRVASLPVYGPAGNKVMPSTVSFMRSQFDPVRGTYRYLGDFLSPLGKTTYKLKPFDVIMKKGQTRKTVFSNARLTIDATTVEHGPVPALAWRVEANGKSITFSGDTSGRRGNLEALAKNTGLLVAHNAVPENSGATELALHMPPSVIGRIAQHAGVQQLVLSHRMLRTLGREDETLGIIRKSYNGPVTFANDLDCFHP